MIAQDWRMTGGREGPREGIDHVRTCPGLVRVSERCVLRGTESLGGASP